jgi:hypothetical protein
MVLNSPAEAVNQTSGVPFRFQDERCALRKFEPGNAAEDDGTRTERLNSPV